MRYRGMVIGMALMLLGAVPAFAEDEPAEPNWGWHLSTSVQLPQG